MPNWLTFAGLSAFIADLHWSEVIVGALALILGTIIISIFVSTVGGFRSLYRRYQVSRALQKYRKDLKKEVGKLTVIGRREGFDLAKVYIEINVNNSDLMGKSAKSDGTYPQAYRNAFVLVGGPGAGKSTYVRKMVLDALSRRDLIARLRSLFNESPEPGPRIPFFVRLREYGAERSQTC